MAEVERWCSWGAVWVAFVGMLIVPVGESRWDRDGEMVLLLKTLGLLQNLLVMVWLRIKIMPKAAKSAQETSENSKQPKLVDYRLCGETLK